MPRYFVEVSYKGTIYSGFQTQQNAITIQSEVEKALQIFFRQHFFLTGSSRTDAGVHAIQNFFHFDSENHLLNSNDELYQNKKNKVVYSLNSILPKDIIIKKIFKVENEAHCRFNAISREYKYYIYQSKNPFLEQTAFFYPYPISMDLLHLAAEIVLRTTNFTSFAKKNSQVKNFISIIQKSEWYFENDLIVYNVIANRFLRGMVRALVATMLRVASGKNSVETFKDIIEKKDPSLADFNAPSQGLFLIEIKYNFDFKISKESTLIQN